ncbi:DUF502 domain-containing protein [Haloferax sp. DFSO52]|uniref:DUF502 domain-containing protein n=1 Tax=Haloferax sp. DFSO52 TaxID=3388505 RepID=UPI003A8A3EED
MADMTSGDEPRASPSRAAGRSIYKGLLDVVLTGLAIIVPIVVTVYILDVALGVVTEALGPFVGLLEWLGFRRWDELNAFVGFLADVGVYALVVDVFSELVALTVLFGVIVVVGSVGRNRYGEFLIGTIDGAIASIPAVGTVYQSFRRMGDVMLDTDVENFDEITLVDFLGDGTYVLGFETGDSPESVCEATGEEMVTVFLPMAPNPVTGGFLTHVPRSQLVDVDMTIEEGVRSILTSGVASGGRAESIDDVSIDELRRLRDVESLRSAVAPNSVRDHTDDDARE